MADKCWKCALGGSYLKVIWAVLCQTSVIDKETNNLSLFNVIEEITIPAEPPTGPVEGQPVLQGIAAVVDIVTLWARSNPDVPERGYGRLQFSSPSDQGVMIPRVLGEYEVDLSRYLRLRHRTRMAGFPITGQGMYRFVIDSKSEDGDWETMFEVPLRVATQLNATA